MNQTPLPLKHPEWTRRLDQPASLRCPDWRRTGADLRCRLSRARLVNLRERQSKWHWIALSFVSVLVMIDIG